MCIIMTIVGYAYSPDLLARRNVYQKQVKQIASPRECVGSLLVVSCEGDGGDRHRADVGRIVVSSCRRRYCVRSLRPSAGVTAPYSTVSRRLRVGDCPRTAWRSPRSLCELGRLERHVSPRGDDVLGASGKFQLVKSVFRQLADFPAQFR